MIKSKELHFSGGIVLNKDEINVEKKLSNLRKELFDKDASIITGNYYDKYNILKESKLYEALN